MSDLESPVRRSGRCLKTLSERPDNMTLLKLFPFQAGVPKATCRASVRALPKWSGVRNTMPGPS